MTKDQGKNYHRRQRLDDCPRRPNDCLLIPHLDISPNEKVKKFPELPDGRQIQVEKPHPGLNPNNGACGYVSQSLVYLRSGSMDRLRYFKNVITTRLLNCRS